MTSTSLLPAPVAVGTQRVAPLPAHLCRGNPARTRRTAWLRPLVAVSVLSWQILGLASPLAGQVGDEPETKGVAILADGRRIVIGHANELTNDIEVEAIWRWSQHRPPWRTTTTGPAPERANDDKRWATLRAEIGALRNAAGEALALPADLQLIAAPVAMWSEVPEPLLPRWPVPESGRLALPYEADRPWRLRLVGAALGSDWHEVAPGSRQARIALKPAPIVRTTIVGADGEPLAGARLAVLADAGASGRRPRRLSWYEAGADGMVIIDGGGARDALGFEASAVGHAARVLVATLDTLPDALRLERGTRVEGRTVDHDGRPLGGVGLRLEAWLARGHARSMTRHAESAADGRFAFAELPAGKVLVVVDDPSFAPHEIELTLEPGAATADAGDLELVPAATARLVVIDDTETAVAGALVVFAAGQRAETDAEGRAALSPIDPSAALALNVRASGHVPAEATFRPPHDQSHRVVLERSYRVSGRLVDDAGAPIRGATASVEIGSRSRSSDLDSVGRFDIDLQAERAARLCLRAPTALERCLEVAPGPAGTARDLGDIVAESGMHVRGSLVRRDDGAPVAAARIWALRPAAGGEIVSWVQGDLIETRSQSDGTFLLRGLPRQPIMIRIDAAGLARDQVSAAPAEEDGEAVDLGRRELGVGATVEVIAESAADGALARLDLGGRYFDPEMLVASVSGGRATIRNVSAGDAILSIAEGHELACSENVAIPGDGETIEVACGGSTSIVRGTVLVGERPVSGGALVWQPAGAGEQPAIIMNFTTRGGLRQQQTFGGGPPSVRVAIDASGFFSSAALHAGDWRVAWQANGGGSSEGVAVHVPDADVHEVVLRFDPLAIRGRVVDAAGIAVSGAYVASAVGGHAVSQGDGSFVLTGLGPGRHRIHARRRGLWSEETPIDLRAGEVPPGVVLTLAEKRERELAVTVRHADERPAPGALVVLEGPRGQSFQVLTTDAEGVARHSLQPPHPELLRAAAFADGRWLLGSWSPIDEAGARLAVTAVGAPGSLRIRGGTPGMVTIEGPDGWNLGRLLMRVGRPPILAADSALTVPGLPAGQYRIGLGTQSITAAVTAGATAEVELSGLQ